MDEGQGLDEGLIKALRNPKKVPEDRAREETRDGEHQP